MRILFAKSKWERPNISLPEFLDQIKAEGYHCTELGVATPNATPEEIRRWHEERGLKLVAQLHTEGSSAAEHLASLDRLIPLAAKAGAFRINIHTGKDYFPVKENVRLFERSEELAAKCGIPVSHETHRGRALFAAFITREYLNLSPFLRLTADFSHWMTVHESELEDQAADVNAAIQRADHVHARVGFPQGPQIPDPFAPEHEALLARYVGFWRAILKRAAAEGKTEIVVTPEAGPAPYMPVLPLTRQPLADTWEINRRMMQFLSKEWANEF